MRLPEKGRQGAYHALHDKLGSHLIAYLEQTGIMEDDSEFATFTACRTSSVPRLGVGIDNVARLQAVRPENHLRVRLPELLDVVRLHALELHLQHARLEPFAIRPERDVADNVLNVCPRRYSASLS